MKNTITTRFIKHKSAIGFPDAVGILFLNTIKQSY